jgi:RNA polymerase sigma-70 factor (ECF subfamily)
MVESERGEAPTFRELFDTHAEALRRYARRIVRSREAAEDLVQEVFFRLWRGWETVEVGPGIRAYLYVATRSRALNHLRHEDTEARARVLAFPRGVMDEGPALPPEGERKLENDDIARAIEQVLAGMPPRQREVAALRLRHQLTAAAIAERLGISPRTVEVHIGRATKALREQLPALLAR